MAIGPTRFTYFKQDGFEVWGKEYQGTAGAVTWRLRVFSEQDRRIETYEHVTGAPPEGTRTGEGKAIRDAIASWLSPANDEQASNFHFEGLHSTEAMASLEDASQPNIKLPLSEEERNSLSPRARAYLEYLERELSRRKS